MPPDPAGIRRTDPGPRRPGPRTADRHHALDEILAETDRINEDTTVVFPAPLMSTFQELGTFLGREGAAARSATEGLVPAQRQATAVVVDGTPTPTG